MINLAWGGLTNGQIDTSILVDVSGRGDYLEPTAAHQFLAMRAALHAATGVWINPAPGSSAYRPLAIQQQFYAAYRAGTGNVAAVPGTSNHGWGRAVDITGYESNAAVWAWLLAHASEFGYSWATGQASGERWHWESLTAPGTTIASDGATPIGEDMPLTNDDISLLLNHAAFDGGPTVSQALKDLYQVYAGLYEGGPSVPGGGSIVNLIAAIPAHVWATTVQRGDQHISALQELADAKTVALRIDAAGKNPVDVTALAAAIVAKLPQGQTITADQIADVLAARLAS